MVHAALQDLLERTPRAPTPHAVVDWDDTMIEGDTSLALMRHVDRTQGTRYHDRYFELLAAHGREVAYPQITRWFAGLSEEEFSNLGGSVIDEALRTGSVRWRPEMVALVEALQARGWEVWVVTASPSVVVRAMADRIGIRRDRVLGMTLELDANGRFTDRILEPATFCGGKARAVEAALGSQPTLVAGDSRSDFDMMSLARHALLLHGHDKDLLRDAQARSWWIQGGWTHTPAEPGVRVVDHG